MLREIKFNNYRCFENSKILFKDLSVVVGKNNSGKSTVIEALRIISTVINKYKTAIYQMPQKSFNLPIYQKGIKINLNNLRIDLRGITHFYKDTEATITAVFTDKTKIVVSLNKEIVFANLYDSNGVIINSRKRANEVNIEPISIMPPLGLIKEQEKLLTIDTVKNDIDTHLSSRHFRNELLLYKVDKFEKFKDLAEQTWRGLRIISLEYDISKSEFIQLMIQDAGFPAEIGLMGSGIQMWLQIIWFISKLDKNSTVILDEPDVYMHPDLQRKILRIVRNNYKQVIIATHSVEIISEVEAKNILKIDKKSRRMSYATDSKGVQSIIDNIGSIQNLSLIRLGDTKRCLFVEGKDVKLLSKFCEILYPKKETSLEMIPWISLGGWSRFSEALGTARLFYEETNQEIKTICILDRDYHLKEEIDILRNKALDSHLNLFVWNKKEIENYLVVPEVIFRLTGLDISYYESFYENLSNELDIFKDDVIDHYAQQIKKVNSQKEYITCSREARKLINENWNSVEDKIGLVNGKEALTVINKFMKNDYNKACSFNKILSKFTADDISEDIKIIIKELIE